MTTNNSQAQAHYDAAIQHEIAENLSLAIIDSGRPHAVEAFKALKTPFRKRGQEHLRIGRGLEVVAQSCQLLS